MNILGLLQRPTGLRPQTGNVSRKVRHLTNSQHSSMRG
nr:MAG TPA: hypothetical protein [Caudoviricetes sp.]